MPVIAVESQVELDVLKKKSLEAAAAAAAGMPRGWDAVNAFQAEEFGKELKKVKAAPARPRARAPARPRRCSPMLPSDSCEGSSGVAPQRLGRRIQEAGEEAPDGKGECSSLFSPPFFL